MHMHGTIKNNHNYTHIWVLIILSVRVTHFLSHRDIHEFHSFFFFLDIQNEFTLFSLIGFFMVYLYYTLHLLHNINSSRTEI